MRLRAAGVGLLVVLVALGLIALSSGEDADSCEPIFTPRPAIDGLTQQLAALATPRGSDDLLVQIEEDVPGFASMSTERSPDILVVRVTRRGVDVEELRAAIVARFPALASREIQIEAVARFDRGQLSEWHSLVLNALLASPEVLGHMVAIGIDDSNNAVTVGLDSDSAVQAAEREIAKLGLPPGAVGAELGPLLMPVCLDRNSD